MYYGYSLQNGNVQLSGKKVAHLYDFCLVTFFVVWILVKSHTNRPYPSHTNFCPVTFFLVWILVRSQTDIHYRHTDCNAYEPTVHTHRWAQKQTFKFCWETYQRVDIYSQTFLKSFCYCFSLVRLVSHRWSKIGAVCRCVWHHILTSFNLRTERVMGTTWEVALCPCIFMFESV